MRRGPAPWKNGRRIAARLRSSLGIWCTMLLVGGFRPAVFVTADGGGRTASGRAGSCLHEQGPGLRDVGQFR
ncbi:hypothetical protein SAMN02745775_11935 [Falsiroseomonas stagni DSM 19981]|uniref:Uncharacterized protein n=1 Tax=Falsiroseomonas stagni DSM 19981 TaxID=1123062 RepID=A0A1I4EUN2_9PROT|nr:hypothetical protein SAMN02745775_11935 [Falsiroseomonas stagni DSM 19981]